MLPDGPAQWSRTLWGRDGTPATPGVPVSGVAPARLAGITGQRAGGNDVGPSAVRPTVRIQLGSPAEAELVRDAWDSGELTPFYSYNTPNNDLSSMSLDYPFVGTREEVGQPSDSWLREAHVDVFFKSREHFFQFVKCMYATQGMHGQQALTLATDIMRMTPKEAKAATQNLRAGMRRQRGEQQTGLRGLDVQAWERDKVSVMLQAARQQVAGCRDFGTRLDRTGNSLLAEAASNDGFWGIGMTMEAALQVPQRARQANFGENKAGVALMIVRAERRAHARPGEGEGLAVTGQRAVASASSTHEA